MPAVKSFRPKANNYVDIINAPPLPSVFDNKNTSVEATSPEEVHEEEKGMEKNFDIGELSWTDKERVLRLLFSKMNGVAYSPVQPGDDGGGDEYAASESQSEYESESTSSVFDARFASIGTLEGQAPIQVEELPTIPSIVATDSAA